MVIGYFHIVSIAVNKTKADPPLAIYGDRILPRAISAQGMESIASQRL
jgi:hypothetical protein